MSSSEQQPKRRLKISLTDLELAFETPEDAGSSYLDLETGDLPFVPQDTDRDAVVEEFGDLDPESDEFAQAVEESEWSDWEQEIIRDVLRVEAEFGTRYIALPSQDSRQGYDDMESFVESVRDARLQDRLSDAIRGRGAFRRFKDVLSDHPGEQSRWYEFRDARSHERLMAWLDSVGVEPEFTDLPPAYQPDPDRLEPRAKMIEEALGFVRKARELPGVLRIALIGSLTTDKPAPKDVDMLVTVADDMGLEPLAALGRKLSGHMQGLSRGGEVFLADPRGAYLGRTCHWRDCRPGIRMSCNADHCGRRQYLHDDLKAVKLAGELIAAPPIELWPEVKARAPVPEDIERGLLEPLRADRL